MYHVDDPLQSERHTRCCDPRAGAALVLPTAPCVGELLLGWRVGLVKLCWAIGLLKVVTAPAVSLLSL